MKPVGVVGCFASVAFLGVAIYCNWQGDVSATLSAFLASYAILFGALMMFGADKE